MDQKEDSVEVDELEMKRGLNFGHLNDLQEKSKIDETRANLKTTI